MKHVRSIYFFHLLAILVLGACSLRAPDSLSIRIQPAERESTRFGLHTFSAYGSDLGVLPTIQSDLNGDGFWTHMPCFYIEARSAYAPPLFPPGYFDKNPHGCSDTFKQIGLVSQPMSEADLFNRGVEFALPAGPARFRLMGLYVKGYTPASCSTIDLKQLFLNAGTTNVANPAIFEYGASNATVTRNTVVELQNSSIQKGSNDSKGTYSNDLYSCLNPRAAALAAACSANPAGCVTPEPKESNPTFLSCSFFGGAGSFPSGCSGGQEVVKEQGCASIPFGSPFFSCQKEVTTTQSMSCSSAYTSCHPIAYKYVVNLCNPQDGSCHDSYELTKTTSCSLDDLVQDPSCTPSVVLLDSGGCTASIPGCQ